VRGLASGSGPGLGTSLQLGWDRGKELEADHIGVIYMAKAGYDPKEALKLLERMEEREAATGGPSAPAWVSNHPSFPERQVQLINLMDDIRTRANGIDGGAVIKQSMGLGRAAVVAEDAQSGVEGILCRADEIEGGVDARPRGAGSITDDVKSQTKERTIIVGRGDAGLVAGDDRVGHRGRIVDSVAVHPAPRIIGRVVGDGGLVQAEREGIVLNIDSTPIAVGGVSGDRAVLDKGFPANVNSAPASEVDGCRVVVDCGLADGQVLVLVVDPAASSRQVPGDGGVDNKERTRACLFRCAVVDSTACPSPVAGNKGIANHGTDRRGKEADPAP
jgi:hypothetical protein